MNCRQAQRSFDDLTRDRLPEPRANEVRQHLADCTDCRVAYQRTARLQRLLALKRYEQPAPPYFQQFLAEFHRRQAAEADHSFGTWEWLRDNLAQQGIRVWQYGFAGATVVLCGFTILWMGFRSSPEQSAMTGAPWLANTAVPLVITGEPAPSRPVAAVNPFDTWPSLPTTSTGTDVVLVPDVSRTDSGAQRYVLDQLAVTPASYEVAKVSF